MGPRVKKRASLSFLDSAAFHLVVYALVFVFCLSLLAISSFCFSVLVESLQAIWWALT